MESQVGKPCGNGRIRMMRRTNVGMEGFEVHDCGCSESWRVEYGCSEGGCKLLVSEYWPKIVRVNSCIIPFPLFMVDVPSSSQCVQFGSKFSRMETNHEVKVRQEFQPAGLLPCQNFGSGKVFEILVICDDIDRN